jgi:hypothetical protein
MIEITDSVTYFPECQTILAVDSSQVFDDRNQDPLQVAGYKVAPWGVDNLLPQAVLEMSEKSDIVGANASFNRNVAYGLGPKLVKQIRDEKTRRVVDFYEVDDGPEYEFFDRNDIPLYLLESLTDMCYFHNAFGELIPDKDWKKIHSLRNKEAVFSRWGVLDNGEIRHHLYSAKWADSPDKKDVVVSRVIDEFNAVADVHKQLALKRNPRLVFPIYMPSPGRPYYSYPSWYSIFRSGWFDQSVSIPALKKAILKNKLGIQFIIYISPRYFDARIKEEGIDPTDLEAIRELRAREVKAMNDFLSGEDNAAKSIVAFKEFFPVGNSGHEEKYIEIEPIKNTIDGGEYIADIETAANTISYAMGVHPSLIGAVPGKNAGSHSGTDKRELFLMKQALMKPLVDRCLRPFSLIKKINGWDKDITIAVPEYIFTTLDKNKSGKQESTTNLA